MTDREAADLRARKLRNTAESKLQRAMQAHGGQREVTLRRVLAETRTELATGLVAIYVGLPQTAQEAAELIKAIDAQIAFYVKSSMATHGQGTPGAARQLARMSVGSVKSDFGMGGSR